MNENLIYPAKLAVVLLVKFGEITFTEIKALPFVYCEDDALLIVDLLRRKFDVEFYDREIEGTLDCDNVIRLINNPLRRGARKALSLGATEQMRFVELYRS